MRALKSLVEGGLVKIENDRIHVVRIIEIYRKQEVYWKLHR
jgi:hypothetical protein